MVIAGIPASTLLCLFLLALVAGIIDAMAGGGGLLTVPGLMAAGLPPVSALATNKLQGIFSSLSATIHFWRKGKIRFRDHIVPALAAFAGAIGGAASLTCIDPALLKKIIPFLLIAIAFWVLCSPKLGDVPRKARISFLVSALTFIPIVGFYDGFLGPGTGTFFALGNVALLGLKLDEATIRAKIYNFMSNLGGLLFFILSDHVMWIYGGAMIIGTIIGGNIGARLILKHGVGMIRPVLVIMSLAMSVKLLWQQDFVQKVFN
jgi:uncharacterized membrane protein YfcA